MNKGKIKFHLMQKTIKADPKKHLQADFGVQNCQYTTKVETR